MDIQASSYKLPTKLISGVINRDKAGLPDTFVPLARGIAVASPSLLQQVGYRAGMRHPVGWEGEAGFFFRWIDIESRLIARQVKGRDLWGVERRRLGLGPQVNEVLVLDFEKMPVFNRNETAAMQLAEYCHANSPPPGLTWLVSPPISWRLLPIIQLARKRRTAEQPSKVDLTDLMRA